MCFATTLAIQKHRKGSGEVRRDCGGRRDGTLYCDFVISEEVVNADSIRCVHRGIAPDTVPHVATVAVRLCHTRGGTLPERRKWRPGRHSTARCPAACAPPQDRTSSGRFPSVVKPLADVPVSRYQTEERTTSRKTICPKPKQANARQKN